MSGLKRILYVEDEPHIREIVTVALESVGGYEVRACACGRDALEAAPAFTPDLVLLDVMMPEMDGPATLAALRKVDGYGRIPVIFMTAKVQASEVKEYVALGAIGVIGKPFDPMTISDRVKETWEKRPGGEA